MKPRSPRAVPSGSPTGRQRRESASGTGPQRLGVGDVRQAAGRANEHGGEAEARKRVRVWGRPRSEISRGYPGEFPHGGPRGRSPRGRAYPAHRVAAARVRSPDIRSPTKWYLAAGVALANCQLLLMTDTPVRNHRGPPTNRRPAVIPDRALSENVTSVAQLR